MKNIISSLSRYDEANGLTPYFSCRFCTVQGATPEIRIFLKGRISKGGAVVNKLGSEDFPILLGHTFLVAQAILTKPI